MSLEDIVDVQISASSAAPTRAGFGVPLIAAYHDLYDDVVRAYSSLAGMAADGFLTTDVAYQQAAVMFSQNPRVRRVKIGRRSLPFTQVVDLTPAAPSAGKVYAVHVGGVEATYTATGDDNLAAVCTAVASAITTVGGADADAIITTRASSAGIQTIVTTGLNGVVGDDVMSPPRALAFVFNSHADWDATTAVVTGTNGAGDTITENFSIPNGGNATVSGTTLFRTVTQVVIPAQTGTNGTFTLGTRARVTASGSSGTKVVATSIVGDLVAYEGWTDTLSIKDAGTDPGIATDLAAIRLADPDWYGLVLDSNSDAEVLAAAVWAEANGQVLFVMQTGNTKCVDPAITDDVMSIVEGLSFARTVMEFHPSIASSTGFLAAGILGNRLPADPGSDTWAFKTLPGVSSYTLTETQKTALHDKKGGTYTVVGGVAITEGAKVASGEWVDVVRGIDWFKSRCKERLFGTLLNNAKLAFTDRSVNLIKGQVLAQINEGIGAGLFAADPPPQVTAPLVADVDAADKQARNLPGVEFSATLAGAIHAVTLTGTVST